MSGGTQSLSFPHDALAETAHLFGISVREAAGLLEHVAQETIPSGLHPQRIQHVVRVLSDTEIDLPQAQFIASTVLAGLSISGTHPLSVLNTRLENDRRAHKSLVPIREAIRIEFNDNKRRAELELEDFKKGSLARIKGADTPSKTAKMEDYAINKLTRTLNRHKGSCIAEAIQLAPAIESETEISAKWGLPLRRTTQFELQPSTFPTSSPYEHTMDVFRYAENYFTKAVLTRIIEEGWHIEINQLPPFDFAQSLKDRNFTTVMRYDTIRKKIGRYIAVNPETLETKLFLHVREGESLKTQIEGALLLYQDANGRRIQPHQIQIASPSNHMQARFRELTDVYDLQPDTVILGHRELIKRVLKEEFGVEPVKNIEDINIAGYLYVVQRDGQRETILSANMSPEIFGDRCEALVTELQRRGTRNFILLGTAGGLEQWGLKIGDVVFPEAVSTHVQGQDRTIQFENFGIPDIGENLDGWNVRIGGTHYTVRSAVEETKQAVASIGESHASVDCEVMHCVSALEMTNARLSIILSISDIPGTERDISSKGLGFDTSYEANNLSVSNLRHIVREMFRNTRKSPPSEKAVVENDDTKNLQYTSQRTKEGVLYCIPDPHGETLLFFPISPSTQLMQPDFKRTLHLLEDLLNRRAGKAFEHIDILRDILPFLRYLNASYGVDVRVSYRSKTGISIRDGVGFNAFHRDMTAISVGNEERMPWDQVLSLENPRVKRAYARKAGHADSPDAVQFLVDCLHAQDSELRWLAAHNLRYHSLTNEQVTTVHTFIKRYLKHQKIESTDAGLILLEHPQMKPYRHDFVTFLKNRIRTARPQLQTAIAASLQRWFPPTVSERFMHAILGRHFPVTRADSMYTDIEEACAGGEFLPLIQESRAYSSQKLHRKKPLQSRFPEHLTKGVLSAVAIGDAFGAPLEFLSTQRIYHLFGGLPESYEQGANLGAFRLNPGSATDDFHMGAIILDSLIECGGWDQFDVARRYGREIEAIDSGAKIDPGYSGSMRTTMRKLRLGCHPTISGKVDSRGCGAAMRVFGIPLVAPDHQTLHRWVIESASMTHNTGIGRASAIAVAQGIRLLLEQNQMSKKFDRFDFIAQISFACSTYSPFFAEHIDALYDLIDLDPQTALGLIGTGGRALEAVPAALYCFLHSPDNFDEILKNAVLVDGDSDSIGAMALGFYGALHGYQRIPNKYLRGLREVSLIDTFVERLKSQ